MIAGPIAVVLEPGCSAVNVVRLANDFIREGYVIVRGVISPDVCANLRNELDRIYLDFPGNHPDQGYGEILRVKLFYYSKLIRDHIDYSPVIDVVEKILGSNCHLIANTSARNYKGFATSNWHVDDELIFPLPDGVEHDERVQIPCHVLNAQWYLTDVGIDDGPTQIVPFSHRSGRNPPPTDESAPPIYREHLVQSIVVKAGDVCLQHSQVWHRGAPVLSDKRRYLLQYAYGRRSFSQRLHPFVNFKYPECVLEGASQRRLRLLGFHDRGPWG
jgi:ectoine hydroxylase-related dioxygenase (phytanoyl-CoA dioxygenase family)